jgi:hypothetical protein
MVPLSTGEHFDDRGILGSSSQKKPFPGKLWLGIGVLVAMVGAVLVLAYVLMAQHA